MVGNGLIAEEVFAVQAAAELLQEAKHIVDAVHHGEAEKVLLPIKRGCGRKAAEWTTGFQRTGGAHGDAIPDIFSPP